jgi:hypothetical protein
MRPRALRRYHSLSVFSNTAQTGAYTPFQAAVGATRMPIVGSRITSAMSRFTGIDNIAPADLGPGLLSFMGSSRRMDAMEAKQLRSGKVINPRMARKMDKADRSIQSLMRMNNATGLDPIFSGKYNPGSPVTVRDAFGDRVVIKGKHAHIKGARNIEYYNSSGKIVRPYGNIVPVSALDSTLARVPGGIGGLDLFDPKTQGVRHLTGGQVMSEAKMIRAGDKIMNPSLYQSKMAGAVGVNMGTGGVVGVRGDLLMSALPGQVTQFYGGYARAALGFGDNIISEQGIRGVEKARTAMQAALDDLGIKANADDVLRSRQAGGQGIRKALGGGRLGTERMTALMKHSGSRGVLATRGAYMAIPGLQALGTASLLYDLGKMAGEVVVSGINLAKDAYKSVQGTINKPSFGMGYQDTEAAATSRARGVMAIQNSRLNARSMLGSEAGMMAAHFG